ncbi:MAG: LptF/LptG family permease [Catalinimonas sp.]
MKKIDRLILRSFFGPFLLTFAVVEFILLTNFIIRYLDHLVGKGLGVLTVAKLVFYFSLSIAPTALPLAVLLSSLMTFGSLGEHRELSAIKSAGISLLRVLRPVGIFVALLTVGNFFFNNKVLPYSNLKAYSLLFDIKQKKPSFDLKEGVFYDKIPNYRIKVNEKMPDGSGVRDVIIYDHTNGRGNTDVVLADSGQMYNILGDRYLVLELFNGNSYSEMSGNRRRPNEDYVRNVFARNKMVFSLASFEMSRTDEGLFAGNKLMRTVPELAVDVDSMRQALVRIIENVDVNVRSYYTYNLKQQAFDSLATSDEALVRFDSLSERRTADQFDDAYQRAVNQARSIRTFTQSYRDRAKSYRRDINVYRVEGHKRFTQAISCFVLFLIGAPLGAIVKKGGLGMPVLISILFFIILYVLSIMGNKWAVEGLVQVPVGTWTANFVLALVGLFFLAQARNDSALLDGEAYMRAFRRITGKRAAKKPK